jgi:hypothetical protein
MIPNDQTNFSVIHIILDDFNKLFTECTSLSNLLFGKCQFISFLDQIEILTEGVKNNISILRKMLDHSYNAPEIDYLSLSDLIEYMNILFPIIHQYLSQISQSIFGDQNHENLNNSLQNILKFVQTDVPNVFKNAISQFPIIQSVDDNWIQVFIKPQLDTIVCSIIPILCNLIYSMTQLVPTFSPSNLTYEQLISLINQYLNNVLPSFLPFTNRISHSNLNDFPTFISMLEQEVSGFFELNRNSLVICSLLSSSDNKPDTIKDTNSSLIARIDKIKKFNQLFENFKNFFTFQQNESLEEKIDQVIQLYLEYEQ